MGLIGGLLTLPLAPVRGVVWLAQQLQEHAERELYDASRIQAQLLELQLAYDSGIIDESTYARGEEELLERLRVARRRHSGQQ